MDSRMTTKEKGSAERRRLPQAVPATPRETVQARLPNGAIYEAPLGAPIEVFVKSAVADRVLDEVTPIVAALVNGQLRELTYSLQADANQPQPCPARGSHRLDLRSWSVLRDSRSANPTLRANKIPLTRLPFPR